MKQIQILFLLILTLLIVGCENVDVSKLSDEDLERISDKVIVCNDPYIRFASSCCLDINNNSICDNDDNININKTNNETIRIFEEGYKNNSEEWQNVYSRAIYRAIKNITPINDFKNENNNIYYARLLSADRDITQFIILDSRDYYGAVSVAPYAALTKSYVLFIDEESVEGILDFLFNQEIDKFMMYGDVTPKVRDNLKRFNPHIINKGNRFDNNIEIVKEFKKIKDGQQIIFTDGNFLEESIINGDNPVLFIGKEVVPNAVRDYISNSNIKVAVVIGDESISTATYVKRITGIQVFVKFAQGARNPSGSITEIEKLDRYYFNTTEFEFQGKLKILDNRYDKTTDEIFITLKNEANKPLYFKGTYTLTDGTESHLKVDEDAIRIEAGEERTIKRHFNLIESTNLILTTYIIFGDSEGSMEYSVGAKS